MGHTYHRLSFHLVFGTKKRLPMITGALEGPLFRYIRSIFESHGCRVDAIGGMPDHVHVLCSMPPTVAPSQVIKAVKGGSSRWANSLGDDPFMWQPGYGIFSVSPTNRHAVARYIRRQKEHHQHQSLESEWRWLTGLVADE